MGSAPALRPPPPRSQHGPVEGKPSPGTAAGFYNPENESQRRPCLSWERGHVTAQETAPWERQLVKKGKKSDGAGLAWGRERGNGKACWQRVCSPHPSAWARGSPRAFWVRDCGILGRRGHFIMCGAQRSHPAHVAVESWALSLAPVWVSSGLREPKK